jgi:hypothetical protein
MLFTLVAQTIAFRGLPPSIGAGSNAVHIVGQTIAFRGLPPSISARRRHKPIVCPTVEGQW